MEIWKKKSNYKIWRKKRRNKHAEMLQVFVWSRFMRQRQRERERKITGFAEAVTKIFKFSLKSSCLPLPPFLFLPRFLFHVL